MFIFAFSGEASHDDCINCVLSQQCGAQAWTLRTQDDRDLGTFHKYKAQTVGARASAEHTISAGLWHDLHLGFDRGFALILDIIDGSLPAFGGQRRMAAIGPFVVSSTTG